MSTMDREERSSALPWLVDGERLDRATFHEHYAADLVLRILPENGGRNHDEGKLYPEGPELIVEVSDSSLENDLGPGLAEAGGAERA